MTRVLVTDPHMFGLGNDTIMVRLEFENCKRADFVTADGNRTGSLKMGTSHSRTYTAHKHSCLLP